MATPPKDLDATSRALWISAQKALEDQGTWRDHDTTLLEILVNTRAEAAALRKVIDTDGWTVAGSREQVVAHPLIKPLHEAEAHFLKVAAALKFTPQSRGEEAGKKPLSGKFDSLG